MASIINGKWRGEYKKVARKEPRRFGTPDEIAASHKHTNFNKNPLVKNIQFGSGSDLTWFQMKRHLLRFAQAGELAVQAVRRVAHCSCWEEAPAVLGSVLT